MSNEQISMSGRNDAVVVEDHILALLYAPGAEGKRAEPIRGKTMLQKILLHLRKGLEAGPSKHEMPHFYGFYDEEAGAAVERLEASGYLRIDQQRNTMELTSRGVQEAEIVWSSLSQQERRLIRSLKEFFGNLSLDEVLAVTYAKYPEFAIDSLVRNDLRKKGLSLAIGLVKKGKISLDLASRIANMRIKDFMRQLSKHHISVIEREVAD